MPPIPNRLLTPDRPSPQGPPAPSPTRPSPPPPSDGAGRSGSSPTGSSAASEFAADPGPLFDPDGAPPAPELDARDAWAEDPHWEEQTIREGLEIQGELLHSLVEWRLELDDTDVWLHTQKDLRAIAPPLTRILNRYDVTRAAAAAGDEALLAAGLMRYASRNVIRTRRAMAARGEPGEQPSSGAPAEPDTGPENDPEWQRVHADPMGGAPPSLRPKGV